MMLCWRSATVRQRSIRLQVTLDVLYDPLTLLPVLPLLIAFWLFIVYLRQMDELLRGIQFEAIGFSMGATLIFTFTWGLLESAELMPHYPTILVGPLVLSAWGLDNWIAQRRYNTTCVTD